MNIMIVLQIAIVIILFCVIVLAFRKKISMKKERRIGYYSLEPIRDSDMSFSDKVIVKYLNFIKKIRPNMKKIKYFDRRSKKYEKYIKYRYRDIFEPIDFITNKIVISVLFLLLTIFSQVFTTRILNIWELIINYFIGYYLLDIYLYFEYKKQLKLIENELLRSIIIMNNAFKSGKSTLQALKIASEELPEPICDEFKKMYFDMKYGLSVDTVFDRFAKRVNLDEAVYLSSSLMILDKTGGNIVEVFSSIERTLFDKKKLEEELKNITASSKMITKILFIVPIVFVGVIYFLNHSYFNPLFSSPLGYMIIGIIVIMFIIYIICLKKILKVEV
ncbi:MAG: type II secretion system F family protein [Bacilli bacterium]